jgi:hypothetical protein
VDTGIDSKALCKKGPKLWIQVVRRPPLAQKRFKTMATGSKARTSSKKRVQNYGYRKSGTHLGFCEVEP